MISPQRRNELFIRMAQLEARNATSQENNNGNGSGHVSQQPEKKKITVGELNEQRLRRWGLL